MIVCMYLSLMVLGKNDCLYVSVFDGLNDGAGHNACPATITK